MEVFFSALAF